MFLADFLAEIGRAGGEAARAASEYSEHRLLRLFNWDKVTKTLTPQTVNLRLGGAVIPVPRYALSRAGGLDLDELKVEFEATVDLNTIVTARGKVRRPDTKVGVRFKKGLFRNDTHVKITASFKMGSPPEASELVADRLNEEIRTAIDDARGDGNG